MKSFLATDIKRGIWNGDFLIAVIALFGILFYPLRDCFYHTGSLHVLEWLTFPMATSGFIVFAASFPVIGYAGSFYNDISSGYMTYIICRVSWIKYGFVRIISLCISGGLTMLFPFAGIFLICYVAGRKGGLDGRLYNGMHVEEIVKEYGIVAVLIAKGILGFLFGAFWSLVGGAIGLLANNRHVVIIGPFVIYQFMWIVLFHMPQFNPIFLLRGDDLDSYLWSAAGLIGYVLIASIAIMLLLRWRVKNGKY